MFRITTIILVGLLISACGSKTTVILLPEESGKVGAVSVKTASQSLTIDKPYTYTTVTSADVPSQPKAITESLVNKQYKDIIAAQPLKPVSFLLYFHTGSTKLTEKSKAIIPQVIAAAKDRKPSEISIIGHTDSTGSKDYNVSLSLRRAKVVESIMRSTDMDLQEMYLQSFGESDPLVPTPDNVPEPRNRRVEVMIR